MDISSTSALPSHTYTPSSTKTDNSTGIAMLNEANKMQADSAQQMIQSVTGTTPAPEAPRADGTGRYINVSA